MSEVPLISVKHLSKEFRTFRRREGVWGGIQNLFVREYQTVKAVDRITFDIGGGEMVGYIGPNGAGKTTTIRILIGLLHPDGGTVKIGGHDCWTDHASAARQFGATLEQPGLYGFLSGRDNLRQFARMLGPVDEKQITELLALVGMTERGDDKVKRYSMGMRQRLALAQAMLGRPRLLVLDEPTNGLDPNGIHGLRILLRKLATEEGLTIFSPATSCLRSKSSAIGSWCCIAARSRPRVR